MTTMLIDQTAQQQIKARALLAKLKEIPWIYNVSETWISLTDKSITGATVSAPSMMRTRITIAKLKELGWDVEDKWPASTRLFIKFKLD